MSRSTSESVIDGASSQVDRGVGNGQLSLMTSAWSADDLQQWVVAELALAGFNPESGLIPGRTDLSKEAVRGLHRRQRQLLLARNRKLIYAWEERLIRYFASGEEVDPATIDPEVVPVLKEDQAALFRYASLHWSVPVSAGYGRRTRFLVIDRHNGYLVGIFALGDPVYNLAARDTLIGWNASQRSQRLYNVLDAFVIGSVPPYRELLGGKLIAMAAVSDEVMEFIRAKYQGATTGIHKVAKEPRPVLITTTSALGRSSIYNRLKFKDRLMYESVGFTRGYGHFQFSDELFRALVDFLGHEAPGNKYGEGPNWKIRTLRQALAKIGLNEELLKHGVQREVFLAPIAHNWVAYLRGDTDRPRWRHYRLPELATFWRRRWAVPRSERDHSFNYIERNAMRLTSELEGQIELTKWSLAHKGNSAGLDAPTP